MTNEVFYKLSASKLVALTALGEAATEGTQGLMAVINVIANRTRDPNQFADQGILATTNSVYHAVILKPCQFSVFNDGSSIHCPKIDPGRQRLVNLISTFDTAVKTNAVLNQAYQLSQMLFMGVLADNTGGATHYHATYVSPTWAATTPLIGQIGNHIFYSVYPAWQRVRGAATALAGSPWTYIIGISLIGVLIYFYKRRKQ